MYLAPNLTRLVSYLTNSYNFCYIDVSGLVCSFIVGFVTNPWFQEFL